MTIIRSTHFVFQITVFFNLISSDSWGQTKAPTPPTHVKMEPIQIQTSKPLISTNTQNQSTNVNSILLGNSFLPPKQLQDIEVIRQLTIECKTADAKRNSTNSELPDLNHFGKKTYFQIAYDQISLMLEGKEIPDLKRAVFLTENAYSVGKLSYVEYCRKIKESADLIRSKMAEDGLTLDESNINFMVHRYISDTIGFLKSKQLSYPKKYDFNDPFGYKNVSNLFVSKLLKSESGQCKSLPLLFLILVQELKGNAYLSFSPSHTFIKCRDAQKRMYNIELTNGQIASDSWLLGSGFIKSQSVRSGIYLDTMNTRQVIAHCLVDLAMYYRWNFAENNFQMGYDSFSLQCINKALEITPNDIMALLEKSNYYSALLNVMAARNRYTEQSQIAADPATNAVLIQRNKMYELTDRLGYEYMSEEKYQKWLKND